MAIFGGEPFPAQRFHMKDIDLFHSMLNKFFQGSWSKSCGSFVLKNHANVDYPDDILGYQYSGWYAYYDDGYVIEANIVRDSTWHPIAKFRHSDPVRCLLGFANSSEESLIHRELKIDGSPSFTDETLEELSEYTHDPGLLKEHIKRNL